MISGVLRVDKCEGPTSHDIVATVRRTLGQKRVGHAGTLDPPASGLLVVLLGSATRLQRYAMAGQKEYAFTLVLGRGTATGDTSGAVNATAPPDETLTDERLREAARSLTGEVDLIPPMVSAIRHKGRRLYVLAREGLEVDRQPRRCLIETLAPTGEPSQADDGTLWVQFAIVCSSGTYVRSVGVALGAALGVPACIGDLRRLRSGDLTVEGALPAAALDPSNRDAVTSCVEPMEVLVSALPEVRLGAEAAARFVVGNPVRWDGAAQGEVRVHGESVLLGIGSANDGLVAPQIVLGGAGCADG